MTTMTQGTRTVQGSAEAAGLRTSHQEVDRGEDHKKQGNGRRERLQRPEARMVCSRYDADLQNEQHRYGDDPGAEKQHRSDRRRPGQRQ